MSGVRRSIEFFGVAALIGIILRATIASAEPVTPPAGAGPLPDLSKGGGAGVAISQPYADKYAAVLPKEVHSLLSNGTLAFEAVLSSKVTVEMAPSTRAPEQAVELTSSSSLPDAFIPKSMPFSEPSAEALVRDPSSAAYQVLWNAAAQLWRLGHLDIETRTRVYQDSRSAPRELSFSLSRIYPRSFGPVPGKLVSLFRERVSFTSPAVLAGVKWLTLRYLSTEEDFIWASSPTTSTVRQMTGSNRSDLIFPRGFSLDDLFVWSGKVEGVSIRTIQRVAVLVPVVQSGFTEEKDSEGCVIARPGKGAAFDVSTEGRRVPQAPAWLPSNAYWTLRDTWRIETENRDPFSLDRRSTLYIDVNSSSPVYRMVFGKQGELLKTTIGILGPVDAAAQIGVFWRGEVVISPTEGGATLLEAIAMRRCSDLKPGREIRDFDPKALVPVAKRTPESAKAPKALPKPTAIPDPNAEEPMPED